MWLADQTKRLSRRFTKVSSRFHFAIKLQRLDLGFQKAKASSRSKVFEIPIIPPRLAICCSRGNRVLTTPGVASQWVKSSVKEQPFDRSSYGVITAAFTETLGCEVDYSTLGAGEADADLLELSVNLDKDRKTDQFDIKEYEMVVIHTNPMIPNEEDPMAHVLASGRINFAEYANAWQSAMAAAMAANGGPVPIGDGSDLYELEVEIPLLPSCVNISHVKVVASVSCSFLRDGGLIDDDDDHLALSVDPLAAPRESISDLIRPSNNPRMSLDRRKSLDLDAATANNASNNTKSTNGTSSSTSPAGAIPGSGSGGGVPRVSVDRAGANDPRRLSLNLTPTRPPLAASPPPKDAMNNNTSSTSSNTSSPASSGNANPVPGSATVPNTPSESPYAATSSSPADHTSFDDMPDDPQLLRRQCKALQDQLETLETRMAVLEMENEELRRQVDQEKYGKKHLEVEKRALLDMLVPQTVGIDLSGWLQVKNPRSLIKLYKRRWVVREGGYINMYASPEANTKESSIDIRDIDFIKILPGGSASGSGSVIEGETGSSECSFILAVPSGLYWVIAPDYEEMKRWVDILDYLRSAYRNAAAS
eukprot:TRINITY_DN19441_c0_g1::TRINITY_DN19441_c0_g1_i1::g.17154::m.17154 TRINITY_DN19441_c0_g1::TRINITY_DN19441_c0_g1_i1::g.17154  ORF type:complete len:592 (+),score=131.50,PH/PF00169.24/2.9e+03,PH/PF00169.24/4.7e-08,NT-C2/PF10358.4/0.011,Myosin_tail_1/PF01576.14/0.022,DUF2205/PF10224.4/0.031,Cortex-I_coil/PF09304.5/0.057,Herpes_BLRF2/PF05812.7/0.049,DUF972/PF06156.8/0.081,Lge1/PF11488.3/0.11,IncA/PF04156.9/0.21,Cep57_CLD_2/PF14197.1/0.31,HALZ/PF02183.13/0.52,HALZ/PF02183.13/8e+02,DivIC/PF04977.10/1.1